MIFPLVLGLLMALPLLAVAQAAKPAGINWLTNYHEGVDRAKELNKPVLIDFFASWCGPCRMMDEQTFTDPEVIKAMEGFVNIKIDVDADEKTAFAYGIRSIPRTVVLNIHGEMVGDRVGFMESGEYLAYLAGVDEYLRTKVDGTVITVERGAPEKVEFELESRLDEIMALLANPKPKTREKARAAVLQLDRATVTRWMLQGLASPYLGERIAAKETLIEIDPKAYADFDPWASSEERANMITALGEGE